MTRNLKVEGAGQGEGTAGAKVLRSQVGELGAEGNCQEGVRAWTAWAQEQEGAGQVRGEG